ncbi:MAG TPA: YdeI/OmpD-associated family protein [Candidatus Solibacter sp.]|jgi:uncharacterized protein YdeI (YjbR/CyaY-like superfamily)|nr:YdeI/OmpD-associated family protein [Candidatus Solibacter sp.]
MPAAKVAVKSFEAVLERTAGRLNWTIIRVPFDVAKIWGTRGQLKVQGEINGYPFRTSLFPSRKGSHIMIVNKKMQASGHARPGTKAKFRLQPDTTPREIEPPDEWLAMLRQSKQLKKFYESLNHSTRVEIAKWVSAGKHNETRKRRSEQMAERLMETMEAERELPPLLQVVLARNPKAKTGWEIMSPSHRRSHLLGIFYYRNPESRARRIAKAVQEMVACADKAAARRTKTPNSDATDLD